MKWISTNELQLPISQLDEYPVPVLCKINSMEIKENNMEFCFIFNDGNDYYIYDCFNPSSKENKLGDRHYFVSDWRYL